MRFSILTLASALLNVSAARKCLNQSVPVTLTSRNGVFDTITIPQTNLDVTNFTLALSRNGHNLTAETLSGYTTIHKTYHISTQFCAPDHPKADAPVQILTHGIGFDKTYWDLSYDNFAYSYVKNAVDKHGYYTLSFDRLGIGKSSHGNPKSEIQVFLEVEALRALTLLLRDGKFPSVKTKFSKIVHVGHSFGSLQSEILTAKYPDISDGVVLTGFSTNGSFIPIFNLAGHWQQAALNAPKRLGDFPRGYIVVSNKQAQEILFFEPGHFPPALLDIAEATKQPVTIGELLTLGSLAPVNTFKGPVLVFTGSNDVPFCGGDCFATGDPSLSSIPAAAKKVFVDASDFTAYIQPGSGHGLTSHFNATGGYDAIASYLKSKGL